MHDPTSSHRDRDKVEGEGGDNLDPADRELAASLANLRPAETRPDLTAAAFEAGRRVGEAAGRAAARRSAGRWRLAAAALFAVAATSVGLNARQSGTAQERPAYAGGPDVPPPTTVATTAAETAAATAATAPGVLVEYAPPASADSPPAGPAPGVVPLSPGNLLALRNTALERGIDALPPTPFGMSGAPVRASGAIR